MSGQEIDAFFKEFVYGFIFVDIRREIDLARRKLGGGNFLAALGLLCYTEFLGGVKRGKLEPRQSRRNFEAFFRTLGPAYSDLSEDLDVYAEFRCGMAHEYFVKRRCKIAMLKSTEPCGLGKLPGDGLYFVVEHYFEDFANAARALHQELVSGVGRLSLGSGYFGVPDPSKSGPSVTFIRPGYAETLESATQPLGDGP